MMIRIGTRGSDLARTQTQTVATELERLGSVTHTRIIKTQGDMVLDRPLLALSGKGFFTKELEDALLAGEIDIAIHSLKDLPTDNIPGLTIAAIPKRADVRDTLIMLPHAYDAQAATKAGAAEVTGVHGVAVLPLIHGARLGTSAVRRQAQVAYWRPDVQLCDVRGNVPTRIEKLRQGQYDAILLAQAGLDRLATALPDMVRGLHCLPLMPHLFVPAPGQGALGVQARLNDAEVTTSLAPLHATSDATLVAAERLLLARLEGGCHLPLGAHATYSTTKSSPHLTMVVFMGNLDHPERSQRLTRTATSVPALVDAACSALGVT